MVDDLQGTDHDSSGPFILREELRNVKVSTTCTPTEAYYKLEPFLRRLRQFNPGRFLALLLTIIALVKACVVTGTVRTTALAVSYALSFFPIEILAWTLLEFRPRPSKAELESEAIEIAKLISILDPYRNHNFGKTVFAPILPEDWSRHWFWGFACIEVVVVVAMIFWPMSIIISMFEFVTWQKGGWVFWCFALVTWLLPITGGSIAILIVSFTVDAVARRKREVSGRSNSLRQ
jgi:hypothetical protein